MEDRRQARVARACRGSHHREKEPGAELEPLARTRKRDENRDKPELKLAVQERSPAHRERHAFVLARPHVRQKRPPVGGVYVFSGVNSCPRLQWVFAAFMDPPERPC